MNQAKGKKGQHEILSLILLTLILMGVVGAVWSWVNPIVEKNKEILYLSKTEDFTKRLATAIQFIAKNGGKTRLDFVGTDPNSEIMITTDPVADTIEIFINSKGTIYSKNVQIPLNELECATDYATWGLNSSASICIKSAPIADLKMKTIYTVKFIELRYVKVPDTYAYKIKLQPLATIGSMGRNGITIENKGVEKSLQNGKTLISTLIAINII
jgi:hypothetical protein